MIGNFGGISKAQECDISLIDHYILRLHVVIGISSIMNILNDLKQLAAYVQNSI